jgi:hypothetical protein
MAEEAVVEEMEEAVNNSKLIGVEMTQPTS